MGKVYKGKVYTWNAPALVVTGLFVSFYEQKSSVEKDRLFCIVKKALS